MKAHTTHQAVSLIHEPRECITQTEILHGPLRAVSQGRDVRSTKELLSSLVEQKSRLNFS